MNKLIGVVSVLLLSFNATAVNSVFGPRVESVSISKSDVSFGQVGMIIMSVSTGACEANLKTEAKIEFVPSVNSKYLMEAIVINVFPELTDCGSSLIGRNTILSAKTDELIDSALLSIALEKRALPKILRLPEVAL